MRSERTNNQRVTLRLSRLNLNRSFFLPCYPVQNLTQFIYWNSTPVCISLKCLNSDFKRGIKV
jgi:hypothetical protein